MKKILYVILLTVFVSQFYINTIFAKTIVFEVDATPWDYYILEDKRTDYSLIENEEEIVEEKDTIYDLFSEEEIQLLFRTVETETYGADYESKKNVASVILNRYENSDISLKQIITSPNQFCYGRKDISDNTIKACEDALDNRGNVIDCLYFRSGKQLSTFCGHTLKYIDQVNHYFY